MSKAIKISVEKAPSGYDLGSSKFFGTPTVPLSWENDFDDDEMFFCQIRLSDISELDIENRLPHNGYLYVFVHTERGLCDLRADVRYYAGEPELAFDGFNSAVEGFEKYTVPYLMRFSFADESEDCTRLFGQPSGWAYGDTPPSLLMQYDPLDNDMGFLDHIDGFVYLFFGDDGSDLTEVSLSMEYS